MGHPEGSERRARSESGFGVIEAVIAVFVLSIFILSMSSILKQGSASTGLASMEVTASEVARQWLSYYQQQLDKDVADDPGTYTASSYANPPYLFPYPFSSCSSLAGGVSNTSTTNALCPGGNTYLAEHNGADVALTANVAKSYAYCSGITSPNCSTTPTAAASGNCNTATYAATAGYCVFITGSWQCQPAQYKDNGETLPEFYVQIQVTFPNEPTFMLTASQGLTSSNLSLSENPPSAYINENAWWTYQQTGFNECNPQF